MYKQTWTNGSDIFSIYLMHKYIDKMLTVDKSKLHPLELPVSTFEYLKDWEIWDDGCKFDDVINAKKNDNETCQKQFDRAMDTDLSYPIIVFKDVVGQYKVLDGHHRLVKSIVKKKKNIKAYNLSSPFLMEKFHLKKYNVRNWNEIQKMTKKQFDDLFKERFPKLAHA